MFRCHDSLPSKRVASLSISREPQRRGRLVGACSLLVLCGSATFLGSRKRHKCAPANDEPKISPAFSFPTFTYVLPSAQFRARPRRCTGRASEARSLLRTAAIIARLRLCSLGCRRAAEGPRQAKVERAAGVKCKKWLLLTKRTGARRAAIG